MPIKYCRYGFSLIYSIVSRSLVLNLSLMINAPNAIRNDLAGTPVETVKFWAYSATKIMTTELVSP